MHTPPRWLLVVLLLAVSSTPSVLAAGHSAPRPPIDPPADRPRIGLALEGGGALGLAHVGVLEWLEEHRIPVDNVAGTSMGALVGALYATGMSGAEIHAQFRGIRWEKVLLDEYFYPQLAFRLKEDRRDYPSPLEFGLRHGLGFPSGFTSGEWVALLLDRVSLPYSDLRSFDQLPTPFRCVATDLVTGRPHVFDHGSLSRALRASIASPIFLPPVRADSTMYVDGSIVENLPTREARRMGADVVLAVDLRLKPFDPRQPVSVGDLASRSMEVVQVDNQFASMKYADEVIGVPVESFGVTSFEQSEAIIQAGYRAAARRADSLARWSVDEASWHAYLAARQARVRTAPAPQFVEVQGTSPRFANAIRREFADAVGQPVRADEMERRLTRLSGRGRFARAGYGLTRQDDRTGLLIDVDEKDYAPPIVDPLLEVTGSNEPYFRFSAGARVTALDVGPLGSEARLDLLAGSRYRAAAEYCFRPGWSSLGFMAVRAVAEDRPFDVYRAGRVRGQYRERDETAGLDLGLSPGRSSELRVGYDFAHESLARVLGDSLLPRYSAPAGRASLRYALEALDTPVLPRQGTRLSLRAEWHDRNPDGSRPFPLGEARAEEFVRLSEGSSAFFTASGGSLFGHVNLGRPAFGLGGLLRLSVLGQDELLANEYLLVQVGGLRRLKRLPPLLGGDLYGLLAYEGGRAYGTPDRPGFRQDLLAALVVPTLVGPITLGASVGDGRGPRYHFRLGRLF